MGAASKCALASNVKAKLVEVLGEIPFGTVKRFSRIKIGRQVFHSKAYSWVSKRNSYAVAYRERVDQPESFGQQFIAMCSLNATLTIWICHLYIKIYNPSP